MAPDQDRLRSLRPQMRSWIQFYYALLSPLLAALCATERKAQQPWGRQRCDNGKTRLPPLPTAAPGSARFATRVIRLFALRAATRTNSGRGGMILSGPLISLPANRLSSSHPIHNGWSARPNGFRAAATPAMPRSTAHCRPNDSPAHRELSGPPSSAASAAIACTKGGAYSRRTRR